MSDPINPNHYQSKTGAQLIDSIEHLPGNRFNAAKYIVRAGEKNPETLIEDLDKGLWYQLREFYRLGVIRFNPAEPGSKERLREFLGWNEPDPAAEAFAEIKGTLEDANVIPIRREPRTWMLFADIPEGVEVVDRDGDGFVKRNGKAFRLSYHDSRACYDASTTFPVTGTYRYNQHTPYTEVLKEAS